MFQWHCKLEVARMFLFEAILARALETRWHFTDTVALYIIIIIHNLLSSKFFCDDAAMQ